MAPNSKPRDKPRKNCFFLGCCCFGSFKNQELVKMEKNMSSDNRYDDGKITKFGSSKNPRRSDKTAHVDVLSLRKMSSYSKEVESEVEVIKIDDHKLPVQSVPVPEHQNIVINYKDMILDNSGQMLSMVKQSKKQNGTVQETWSGPIKLSHSVSMPMPPRKREELTLGGRVKEKQGNELRVGAGEIDPIVGALILTVTLIVMLVWGKVSAILCIAIWFYCIPRLIRPDHFNDSCGMRSSNGSKPGEINSLENKKKVVLQGFLERN